MLVVYNSMTGSREPFEPLVPGKVGLYVCGITVYDYCHIGHARMLVAFDGIQRWLRASGYDVTHVRNITDIEDKIIRRAVENGETLSALTTRFIDAMHADEEALGVERPDHEPRATQYIGQMVGIVEKLEANGLAYRSRDGDMLFPVRKFPAYGRLSGKSLDDQRAGERVKVDPGKDDPLDFVLWKSAKPSEPDEAKWPSRYGRGRPGWHLECSAMSVALLGTHFDLHGGGADLLTTHHENELAQSDGAFHPDGRTTTVRYWLHNGFVQVHDEKMAKSLGNFITIREALERIDGEVLRFFLLRAHYRSPINYSAALVDESREALLRLYNAVGDAPPAACAAAAVDWSEAHAARFKAAMDDDFNTAEALAALFDLATRANRDDAPALRAQLRRLGGILGLLQQDPDSVRRTALRGVRATAGGVTAEAKLTEADDVLIATGTVGALSDAGIAARITERAEAKKHRRYADADRIRAELAVAGIVLEDRADGTRWRRG